VCEIVEGILGDQGLSLSSDLRMSLEHYTDMVRRNIVNDSQIARLCQRLYRDHQRAFDLVFEHRFAHRETIRNNLIKLISETPRVIPNGGWVNYPSASYVDFAVQEWDVPKLQVGSRDDRGNRILEFVFGNYPDHLYLDLRIRPGDKETRRKLFEVANAHPSVFNGAKDSSSAYAQIFRRIMRQPSFYDDSVTDTEREQEIRRQWTAFLEEDLLRIETALKDEMRIWESMEAEGPA
jgi:phage pi2 protein 07